MKVALIGIRQVVAKVQESNLIVGKSGKARANSSAVKTSSIRISKVKHKALLVLNGCNLLLVDIKVK